MSELLVILLLLLTKHVMIDFVIQTPYQWKNKGTFLHPGGLIHAALHGFGTFLSILVYFDAVTAATYFVVDSVAHYFIDYAKVNLTKKMGWRAEHNPEFWYAVGIDQYMHQMTYVSILIFLFL